MLLIRNNTLALLTIGFFMLLLQGCIAEPTAHRYLRSEVNTLQTVQFGHITEIEPVEVSGSRSGIGQFAGMLGGGVLGSQAGGGAGRDLAAATGIIAGTIAGQAAEEKITRSKALNLTIKLDSGALVSVVQQPEEATAYRVGDRVKIVSHNNTSRVLPVR